MLLEVPVTDAEKDLNKNALLVDRQPIDVQIYQYRVNIFQTRNNLIKLQHLNSEIQQLESVIKNN